MRKKIFSLMLVIALFSSALTVYAQDIDVKVNPQTGSIKITKEFDNSGKTNINVFNANFTLGAVQNNIFDATALTTDMNAFKAMNDIQKTACIDFVKQSSTSSETIDVEYVSTGSKGIYVAIVTNDKGETDFKYFTYVRTTDYPSVLEDFNDIVNVQGVTSFINMYYDILFASETYENISPAGKVLIAQELFNNKEATEYTSLELIQNDFLKNVIIQSFYEASDATYAAKILSNNSQLLNVSNYDSRYLTANDTYKAKVSGYIRDRGAKGYADWTAQLTAAASEYAPPPPGEGGGGGGSSSTGSAPTVSISKDAIKETTPIEPVSIYSDINMGHWAYESVLRLSQRGVIAGDGNKNFRPDDNVTRAEFLKMILSAMDLYDENAECNFPDVDVTAWYYKYVASGSVMGVVKGDDSGNFNPNAKISRQDAVKIMYNAAMFKNYAISEKRSYVEFADCQDMAEYAKIPIQSMYCLNVINGYEDGTFRPTASITRAEAAKMTFAFLQNCN